MIGNRTVRIGDHQKRGDFGGGRSGGAERKEEPPDMEMVGLANAPFRK